jgi:hypothetical protein
MRKSPYTEEQIVGILKESGAGLLTVPGVRPLVSAGLIGAVGNGSAPPNTTAGALKN